MVHLALISDRNQLVCGDPKRRKALNLKLGRPKGRVFSPVAGCRLLVAFAADARREFGATSFRNVSSG